ncbi:MAG: TrkA family potassium uptake protein [Deltaproteobacteria bacterium]|nr:TrkA family potassium uptake protein [Deltaproteobacteria bacterium]
MQAETFVVIGMGQFGRQLAVSLAEAGQEVLVLDTDMGRVEEIKDVVTRAVKADAAHEETMRALGVGEVAVAIVALGEESFEAEVLAVGVLKQLGVPRIIARATNRQRGRILALVGADQVVYPEVEAAERMARTLASPGVMEEVCLPSGHALVEVKLPSRLAGTTLAETQLRAKYGLNVLALRRPGGGRGGERVMEPHP